MVASYRASSFSITSAWAGDAHLRRIQLAVWQFSFERILVRYRPGRWCPGTSAGVNPRLHIHAEVGGPLEFFWGHKLDAHGFALLGMGFQTGSFVPRRLRFPQLL